MDVAEKFANVGNRPACLKPNAWYAFTPSGEVPTLRVGHTATYVAGEQIVVFIGGAVPDGLCEDTWMLHLCDATCVKVVAKGDFPHRYEHCALDASEEAGGTRLWVFAGADMGENKNDVWELDVEAMEWRRVATSGVAPGKRTLHANAGRAERLVVFGGGSQGAEAVGDTGVHRLDVRDRAWSVVETRGEAPLPRHGHVLATGADGQTFIHGGLSGKTFFDDLFILACDGTWTKPCVSELKPKGRASHGGVFHNNVLYILGGLTEEGVVNDFWRIDTKNFVWEQIVVESSMFPARLDFAMTLVALPEKFLGQNASANNDSEEVNSVEDYLNLNSNASRTSNDANIERQLLPFIMIHGGMDDKGMIYDDFFVFKLSVDSEIDA